MRIADFYHEDIETFGIYLAILSNYRNVCAHEDILYEHRTQRRIPDTNYHAMLKIEKTDDEYIYGKNDLFAPVIIMKAMLTKNQFHDFIREIQYELNLLDAKIDTIPLSKILDKIGFPENWSDIEEM